VALSAGPANSTKGGLLAFAAVSAADCNVTLPNMRSSMRLTVHLTINCDVEERPANVIV